MSNTVHVVERLFLKHKKFQMFFNDYAIASEQNMYSTMGLGICAVMLLFNMSASFAAHDK